MIADNLSSEDNISSSSTAVLLCLCLPCQQVALTFPGVATAKALPLRGKKPLLLSTELFMWERWMLMYTKVLLVRCCKEQE